MFVVSFLWGYVRIHICPTDQPAMNLDILEVLKSNKPQELLSVLAILTILRMTGLLTMNERSADATPCGLL